MNTADQASCSLDRMTLAVLAGGEGARMGTPKSHLTLAGEPILSFLLRQYAWPGPTLLVTAPGREHPPAGELFDREVADAVPGQGPLRGLLTALEAAESPLVAVLTVDMPGVRAEQIEWLARHLAGRPDALGLMLSRPAQASVVEPFPCLLRAAAAAPVSGLLSAGHRSVRRLARDPRFAVLAAPLEWADTVWANLNSPQDLAAWCSDAEAGATTSAGGRPAAPEGS